MVDTLSPVAMKLNFSQVDSEHMSAVLNSDSKRHADVMVCSVTGCFESSQVFSLHVRKSICKKRFTHKYIKKRI